INTITLRVPPLRERSEDIPLLARHFARDIAARLGRRAPALTESAASLLKTYHWPGNARELRNVVERAMILSPGETLSGFDLPPAGGPVPAAAGVAAPARAAVQVADAPSSSGAPTGSETTPAAEAMALRTVIAESERRAVIEALRRARGVRKEAARLLGIDQRNLAYYFRKHGIDPDALPD
ncbi:MAG TPA: helix-turn-helix domain-containing protein, partial [Candidatus Polarisedimenticolia bacterium]|nr:helix-turn-helix domain-containing protein [Candidatus Polarisedimenticolia bacterium]